MKKDHTIRSGSCIAVALQLQAVHVLGAGLNFSDGCLSSRCGTWQPSALTGRLYMRSTAKLHSSR